jgi:uncharacterized protein YbdZ (MbtH family)
VASNGLIYPRALKNAPEYRAWLKKKNISADWRATCEKTLQEISEGWREVIESNERRPRPT